MARKLSVLAITEGADGSVVRFTNPVGEPISLRILPFLGAALPGDTNRAGEAFASTLVTTLLEGAGVPGVAEESPRPRPPPRNGLRWPRRWCSTASISAFPRRQRLKQPWPRDGSREPHQDAVLGSPLQCGDAERGNRRFGRRLLMRVLRSGLVVAFVAVALVTSARLSLQAQDARAWTNPRLTQKPLHPGTEAAASVVDALRAASTSPARRNDPTPAGGGRSPPLHARSLNAPVVLDLAALGRQNVRKDDDRGLDLKGVRLKTGLKLLLDQVDLNYRVVPGDNLLILTG